MFPRLAILSALYLSFSAATLPQQTGPTKTDNSSSRDQCSIAGSVVSASTGDAINKVGVYLQKNDDPGSGYSTHTDSGGHFAINGVEPGRYSLSVEHVGYLSQSYGETSATTRGAILALAPGQDVKDLLFRLVRSAVISGRIIDEAGDPLPGVRVEALRHAVNEGKRTLQASHRAETNDLGEFRLYGLAKGRYLIRAQVEEHWHRLEIDANASGAEEFGYAPIYYPGTADEARAAMVEVAAGQEVPAIDFTLIPVRSFRVRGHVLDATTGQPAKDCFILLVRHDPNMPQYGFNAQAQTGCKKGTFELASVPPGSYYASAILFNSGKQRVARTPVEVENSNVSDVSIVFVPGMDISGRILAEGGEAIDFSELGLWLHDPEQFLGNGSNTTIKPDGSLRIENLPAGNYQIECLGRPPAVPADFYLKDVRANGESVLDRGLSIVAGGARINLEVVVSSAGARIDGTVTDENELPAPGAVVALVPEEPRRKQFRLFKDVTTDQYGKFILRGIAPGKYKLFSWKGVEEKAWEDPDFLKPVEDQGAEIGLDERGHATVRLKEIASDPAKNGS